jgi:hypothetical protein
MGGTATFMLCKAVRKLIMKRKLALIGFAALFVMPAKADGTSVEEIYIARSVRETTMPPTEFCTNAKTGVDHASTEDQFPFRSVTARSSDGRVINANVETIGSAHTCIGRTAIPETSQFYAEIVLGRLAFKAIGECHLAKTDFPERGLSSLFCALNVSDLPADYVGGLVIRNTLYNSTHLVGTETEPPGYAQSSIATVRLWKKRVQ